MRVLVAFDKFKDSLRAAEACQITGAVLRQCHPDWQVDLCPLADGGDGFAEILTRSAGGELRRATVTGPLGAPVEAHYGLVPAENLPRAAREEIGLSQPTANTASAPIAVIEMAQASGLAAVPRAQRDPWRTTSRGTGELILAAAQARATAIVLGVGGSATHDVGLGALSVLGLTAQTMDGAVISNPVPETWAALAKLGGAITTGLPPLYIATDVTNPLLGTFGAANVFATQKGMRPEDFTRLEYMTGRVAALLCGLSGKPPLLCETPGCGAAGGLAFGLHCAADARLVPGYDFVAAWLGLEERLAAADIVITGEGCFDRSSLQGKGPGELVRRALALGKSVHVFAGQVQTSAPGLSARAISPLGCDLATALRAAPASLERSVGAVFGAR